MSRNYKFYNLKGICFISFAVVYWIDVFACVTRFNRATAGEVKDIEIDLRSEIKADIEKAKTIDTDSK